MQSLEIKQVLNLLKNNTKNISFLDIRERKEYVHGFLLVRSIVLFLNLNI